MPRPPRPIQLPRRLHRKSLDGFTYLHLRSIEMKFHRVLASLLLAVAPICRCQEIPSSPVLKGYVTRVGSPTDFDVEGKHILLGPRTKVQNLLRDKNGTEYRVTVADGIKPYLGERLEIYGEASGKTHTVAANLIVLPPRALSAVSGVAIIDAIPDLPAGTSGSTDRLIRADGYRILITSKTKIAYEKPLSSASDIQVNVWCVYSGKPRADGIVVADRVSFSRNFISKSEDKLREKWEFEPASIDPNTHQDPADKFIRGMDPKKFPPHEDQAMLVRINAIGAKLVPKYQVDFPNTEETRIDFGFYLIDAPKWQEAIPLPSGIVLVPYQIVDKMQNDSQLAALLADKVACLLEKQPVALPATATDFGILAGETAVRIWLPPVGLGLDAASLPMGIQAAKDIRLREEQRARVSLDLMQDAGYDIEQAPVTWWLLAEKDSNDLADTPIPRHAEYLFGLLGERWQQKQTP